jgi:uncharacterized protein YjeT (DUF2065 family)
MKIISFVIMLSAVVPALAAPFVSPFKLNSVIRTVSRGGSKPLTPSTAAKISGALSLAQGAYLTLAPSKSLQMYGAEDEISNPTNVKLLRRMGLCIMNTGVYVYCLVFKDYGIKASVAINSLFFLVETISSLFNNESETIGPSKALDLSYLTVTGSTAYAALNNLECFDSLFKVFSVYNLVLGAVDLCFPQQAEDRCGLQDVDEMTPGLVAAIGSNCCALGTLTASLAWGADPVEAIGFTALASALSNLKYLFFTPEVDDIGMNKGTLAFWPLFSTGVAASILLQE